MAGAYRDSRAPVRRSPYGHRVSQTTDVSTSRYFGDWMLDDARTTLVHAGAGRQYEVPLDRATSPAQATELLQRVADKGWATQQDLDDLRDAVAQLTGHQVDRVRPSWPDGPRLHLYAGGRQG